MDDTYRSSEYQNSNKIFFIYSQNNLENEINKIIDNPNLEDIRQIKEFEKGSQLHLIYCLVLKDNYKKQPIILEIEKDGILYSSNIQVQELLKEAFLYKIDFNNKDKKNYLSKFTSPFNEQFEMYAELNDFQDLEIGLSNDYYINLIKSTLNFISSFKGNLDMNFLLSVFIYSYCIQKQLQSKNAKDNYIKRFLNMFNIKSIDIKNIDVKYHVDNKLDIKCFNDELNNISDAKNMLDKLVEMGGKENLEKILLILSYCYLKYFPKSFISLISLEDYNYTKNIYKILTNNRFLYNNFTSDIINFEILFEAGGNITQIENLLRYLPSMEEFFKEFINYNFFLLISTISEQMNKFIDVLSIIKPKKNDDIEKMSYYFSKIMQYCNKDKIVIFQLKNDFFISYANFYAKLNLEKIKIIKEMYESYSTLMKAKDKNIVMEQLNKFYYDTGLQLISQGKDLKNDELIKFFQESRQKEISLSPESVANMIDLKNASEKFRNDFLNNDFKKFDLKVAFKNNFYTLIEKIFENFSTQDKFLILKNWKISPNVNEEVLQICLRKIKEVLIKGVLKKETSKDQNIKILYTDLIDFLCSLFAMSSKKLKNLIQELKELEQNFPSSKLIEIYFRILDKGNKVYPISESFNEHLKEYIQKNSGEGALAIWYKLVIIDNKERLVYLCQHLKPEHAVKKEDFVGYPNTIEERISLYIYLYFGKYFAYKYITELDYYKNSLKAKEELNYLKYEQGMKIFLNYNQFYRLFKLFIPLKQYKEEKYYLEFTSFYDKLNSYRIKYESLNSILEYWKAFYRKTKENDIKDLEAIMKSLDITPLNKFDSTIDKYKDYLQYSDEAKIGNQLNNSIFFMALYDSNKDKYDDENKLFTHVNEEFEQLKILQTNPDIKKLNENIVAIIIDYAINDIKRLKNELNFIQKYFNFKTNDEDSQNNFDIDKFMIEVKKLIPEDMVPNPIKKEEEKKKDEVIIPPHLEEINQKIEEYKTYQEEADYDKFLDNYINIFKELFEDEEIRNLDSHYFIADIIKHMKNIYFYGFYYNTHKYTGEKKNIYIINEFFDIIEVYNDNYNNKEKRSNYIKKLFPLFLDRLDYKGFEEDFSFIKNNLFSQIFMDDNSNKKLFSKCFINIFIQEVKKENIKHISDINKIIEYSVSYLIDDCIPLINVLFGNIFFANLKNRRLDTLLINHNNLTLLEKKCNKSPELKEKLLFYFESNINKIIDDNYNGEFKYNFIKEEYLRNCIKGGVDFLKKPSAECHKDLTLLFTIAFIKVIINKYIEAIEANTNNNEEYFNKIFTENSDQLSYYVLKKYLDIEGNIHDSLTSDKNFFFSENIMKKINEDSETKKYFGFDYLFLPMSKQDARKYNDIIKKIQSTLETQKNLERDLGIIGDINKSNIDIVFCVISNLYLSKFNRQNYFIDPMYTTLFNWFNKKLESNSFTMLNNYTKEILKIFINLKDKNEIKFQKDKNLIIILFALRIVLNTLSRHKANDDFFHNLIVKTKETISKNMRIFNDFFVKYKESNNEINQLIKFILYSHLLFAYLLKKITSKDIKKITDLEFDEKNIFQSLIKIFKSIIDLIRFKGIKNKYNIIYINIIFDIIKEFTLDSIKSESNIIYLLRKKPEFYLKRIKDYFEILNEIGINDEKLEVKESIKIILEDYNYYKNVNKDKNLNYLTTPNLCTKDDFLYQYQLTDEIYPIIDFIKNKKLDEIIVKINYLSQINSLINKIYNEKILKITREDANEAYTFDNFNINDLNIARINNYLNINIPEINNNTRILELINLKDNEIYKMYSNFEDIIKNYNDFFKTLKLYKENKDNVLTLPIQDISKKDIFYINDNEEIEHNVGELANNRLLELIILYSKRNRYENGSLNVYTGEYIEYDLNSIEKQLEKDFFLGKKLLKNQQRIFIFSNEVFSNERNDLLSRFMNKYPQDRDKSKNSNINNFEQKLDSHSGELIDIYHNLQYIIIYLMYYYNGEENSNDSSKERKTSLKKIGNLLSESGYIVKDVLLSNDLYINDIILLYEIVENKYFEHKRESLQNNNQLNNNTIQEEKKNEIHNYIKTNNVLLKEDKLLDAMKKYILRYCLGDYENQNEIFKNMDIDKFFAKSDIWDTAIFNDEKFKKESEDLKKLNDGNNKYLEKYLISSIFNTQPEAININPVIGDQQEIIDNPDNQEYPDEDQPIIQNQNQYIYGFGYQMPQQQNNNNNSEDEEDG